MKKKVFLITKLVFFNRYCPHQCWVVKKREFLMITLGFFILCCPHHQHWVVKKGIFNDNVGFKPEHVSVAHRSKYIFTHVVGTQQFGRNSIFNNIRALQCLVLPTTGSMQGSCTSATFYPQSAILIISHFISLLVADVQY